MGGFLKCVDPDDQNKFLLIRNGEIVFYENVGGVPTPVTPMTQIGLYEAAEGQSLIPNERYKEAPEVFVQPRSIRTVDVNALGIDQSIEIDAPVVTSQGAGKYQISISGGLKGSGAGYTAVAPLEIYRTNGDDANPTWAVPVSGITEATVYGTVCGGIKARPNPNDYIHLYGINYTLRIGIGVYQAGPDYWGTAVSGNHRQTGATQVIASVNGAVGNYLHIAANLASDGAILNINGYSVDMDRACFALLGARCKGGGGSEISGSPVFAAVVVGR